MTSQQIQSLEPRRLLSSPELDLSFGEGGIATVPDFSGHFFVVNQLPSGKIVAAGGSDDPVVARFNSDGSLDTTFDGDGVLALPQNDGVLGTSAGAVGPDGKIYLLHFPTENTDVHIFRFNADGTK